MSSYRSALIVSVLLHLGVLLMAVPFSKPMAPPVFPTRSHTAFSTPLQAATLDEKQVSVMMQKIQNERATKQYKATQALQQAKKELAAAERRKQQMTRAAASEREKKQAFAKSLAQQKKQWALSKKKAEQELKQLQKKKADTLKQQRALNLQTEALKKKQASTPSPQVTAMKTTLINRYKAMIVQTIAAHWIVPQQMEAQLACVVRARLAPDGTVMSVSVIKNSGNNTLDRSAVAAVYKASPLPVPKDPALFDTFRELQLTVRPEGIIRV